MNGYNKTGDRPTLKLWFTSVKLLLTYPRGRKRNAKKQEVNEIDDDEIKEDS